MFKKLTATYIRTLYETLVEPGATIFIPGICSDCGNPVSIIIRNIKGSSTKHEVLGGAVWTKGVLMKFKCTDCFSLNPTLNTEEGRVRKNQLKLGKRLIIDD